MSNKLTTINEQEYAEILKQALLEIRATRVTVAKQINSAVNSIYWNLGKLLFEKQLSEGYGSGVVKQLSVDLKNEFPEMGLSPRNLWDMKRFYDRYHLSDQKLRQAVAVLPWGHNLLLINKIQSLDAVSFYATAAVTKGWRYLFFCRDFGANAPTKIMGLTPLFSNFLIKGVAQKSS